MTGNTLHYIKAGKVKQIVFARREDAEEMEKYSWDEEKDIPEDRNDHTINSQQYGWIPYRNIIGFETEEQKR